MPDPSHHDTAQGALELITFHVAGQDFCVEAMRVKEIRGWTPATLAPDCPAYVRGLINLRGAVLPIVDLACRFGLPSTEPSARHVIIVTQIGGQVAGLLVDAVSDILSADEKTFSRHRMSRRPSPKPSCAGLSPSTAA